MDWALIDGKTLPEMLIEPYHPDLADYLVEVPEVGQILHHPLVVQIYPIPGLANRMYEAKLRELETCSYSEAIQLYERPYRLDKVWEWFETSDIADAELREVLAFAWKDMESDDSVSDQLVQRVMEMLRYLDFTSDADAPDTPPTQRLRVYRGGEPDGVAWSLSEETARWFAARYDGNEPIYQAWAPPAAVLAMFFGRGEQEVFCDPDLLEEVEELD